MPRHLVVGAGPVGRHLAAVLISQGDEVVLASRSGRGPEVPGAERRPLDATDTEAVTHAADGCVAVHNCLNPSAYHRWPELWPPMADALLAAAEHTGAVLVTASNLYPYGPVDGPITEDLPDRPHDAKGQVRAQLWAQAKAAHDAGRVRAVEVRASDYIGAGLSEGSMIARVLPAALAGKGVRGVGDVNQPHSWTDVADVARAMATVAVREDAWGRVWHVPTNAPRTFTVAITDVLAAAGRPAVKVSSYAPWVLALAGVFQPTVRELRGTSYQYDRPFVLDSSAMTQTFGLHASPWSEVCRRTAGVAVTAEPNTAGR